MVQLFVTPAGKLLDRWVQAFPDALPIREVRHVDASTRTPEDVVWLDTSSLAPERKLRSLQDALALGLPVVVLSATPSESEAFRVLKAGARGYCHSHTPPERLREIALVVRHGGIWMVPELMQRLVALSLRLADGKSVTPVELNKLTKRELMVAKQVANGASNREIAETLDITQRTVKAHLSVVFQKLAIRDRVQLALLISKALASDTSR